MVVARRTTEVYSSLKTSREVPDVEAMSRMRTMLWVASFDLMCCRCGCQLSFLLKIILRTCAEVLG